MGVHLANAVSCCGSLLFSGEKEGSKHQVLAVSPPPHHTSGGIVRGQGSGGLAAEWGQAAPPAGPSRLDLPCRGPRGGVGCGQEVLPPAKGGLCPGFFLVCLQAP